MVEITDRKSAKVWLETQSQQTQVWFTARCALRAMPGLGNWEDATSNRLVLLSLRSMLISAAAATCPAAEMKELENAAHAAATSFSGAFDGATPAASNAADAADHAACAACAADTRTRTARASDAFLAASHTAATHDAAASFTAATLFDTNSPGNWQALWSEVAQPDGLKTRWKTLQAQWDADDADWSFWVEWYEGILNGTPMDCGLIFDIATKMTEQEWEAGQAVVAQRIKEIQAEYFAKALPQAEKLSRDEDGKYVVTATVADPDQIIDRIFKQLDFSLKLALRGHNVSRFSDMCTAFQYLDHTRQHCRDDPNAVHMHLKLAREIIQSRLRTGEYHVEDGLKALVSALERHEIQLRADHPEVRKAYETFIEQRLRELDDEKRLEIANQFKALSEDSKARLSDEFVLDAGTLEASTGVAAQGDALKRSGGRSQEMSLIERAAEVTKTADGSAINKGAGLLFRLERIAELLSSLL